jgi:hypothetical protein
MSDPIYCPIRQHWCSCHDYGKRCDDYEDEKEEKETAESVGAGKEAGQDIQRMD